MQLDDYLSIGGCVLVVIGVGMLSIPAALITAGIAMISFGVLVGRKMANDGAVE